MGKARTQKEHDRINATEYPGTRQMCVDCDTPTGRCEDDAIWTNLAHGPLSEECWDKYRDLDEKAERLDAVIGYLEFTVGLTTENVDFVSEVLALAKGESDG